MIGFIIAIIIIWVLAAIVLQSGESEPVFSSHKIKNIIIITIKDIIRKLRTRKSK